jgi:type II secretory pathway pseudopilin PulG
MRQPAGGHTLVEVLFSLGLVAVAAGICVPMIMAGVETARARAATRYLAAQMGVARFQAVGRGAMVALHFTQDATGVAVTMVVDGNRNGVRTIEIEAGTDRRIDGPFRLDDLFPGVVIGLPAGAPGQAVQLGGSNLLSFSPSGTSTSGTVHVLGRDGSQFAVRVLGATGRTRVLRFDAAMEQWVDAW